MPLEGASTAAGAAPCEALLVFTVWRRKTLDKMLALIWGPGFGGQNRLPAQAEDLRLWY